MVLIFNIENKRDIKIMEEKEILKPKCLGNKAEINPTYTICRNCDFLDECSKIISEGQGFYKKNQKGMKPFKNYYTIGQNKL